VRAIWELDGMLDCSAEPIGRHYDDAGHADFTADDAAIGL